MGTIRIVPLMLQVRKTVWITFVMDLKYYTRTEKMEKS